MLDIIKTLFIENNSTESELLNNIVMDSNNILYLKRYNGILYAINTNIVSDNLNDYILWSIDLNDLQSTNDVYKGSIVLSNNEKNLYISLSNKLISVNLKNTTDRINWIYTFDHTAGLMHPNIDSMDNIYIKKSGILGQEELISLNKNGYLRWSKMLGILETPIQYSLYSCIIDDYDFIYTINSPSNKVRCYDNDGEIIWNKEIPEGDFNKFCITLGLNNTLYINSDPYLYCLNIEDGNINWELIWNNNEYTSSTRQPIIDIQNNIYICNNKQIASFTSNGIIRWRVNMDTTNKGHPTLGNDGNIYFIDRIINSNNGSIIYKFDNNTIENHSNNNMINIDNKGIMYVLTNENLYFIQTLSSGLMRSIWPKYGRRNNGISKINKSSTYKKIDGIWKQYKINNKYNNDYKEPSAIYYKDKQKWKQIKSN